MGGPDIRARHDESGEESPTPHFGTSYSIKPFSQPIWSYELIFRIMRAYYTYLKPSNLQGDPSNSLRDIVLPTDRFTELWLKVPQIMTCRAPLGGRGFRCGGGRHSVGGPP